MILTRPVKKIVCRLIVKPSGKGSEFDEVMCEEMLKKEAVDWLYIILWVFTYLYLGALAIFFFANLKVTVPVLFVFLDALQEPYLGALGVYVVLKEIRKRRHSHPSRYLGEFFVIFWVLLLAISTVAVFIGAYTFDAAYKIIFTNSLAALIIFIGSRINRP